MLINPLITTYLSVRLVVRRRFINTYPIEILCVLRGSTQEADGALNGRYRASRYFKLNTIATMAKTIGQKILASGPTVPPVSQRGPLNDALRRFWEGSKPLFGTPYKNV